LDAELVSLRYTAGLLDFSEQQLLQIGGIDSREFVHNQCTSNIKSLPERSWLQTLFLNNRGQIEMMGTVFNMGAHLWISAPAGQGNLMARFSRYIVFDQLELKALSGYAQFRLHGPGSYEIAQRAMRQPLPGHWHMAESEGSYFAEDESGFWIFTPTDKAAELFGKLLEIGARPIGRKAWQVLQVERGNPDLPDVLGQLPQEVGLSHRVAFRKGCYLGQEIMARLEARGSTRYRLMGLLGQRELESKTEVQREGKGVGTIGSSVISPELGGIALVRLRKELMPGDQVVVGESTATVTALPMR
jgi:hypothetical protein